MPEHGRAYFAENAIVFEAPIMTMHEASGLDQHAAAAVDSASLGFAEATAYGVF